MKLEELLAVKTNCFTGIEAEGPFKYKETLFIPGSCSIRQIAEALAVTPYINCLYYGAGNDRAVYEEAFTYLQHTDKTLTVEFNLYVYDSIQGYLADRKKPASKLIVVAYCGETRPKTIPKEGIDFLKTVDAEQIVWVPHTATVYDYRTADFTVYTTKCDSVLFDHDISIPFQP